MLDPISMTIISKITGWLCDKLLYKLDNLGNLEHGLMEKEIFSNLIECAEKIEKEANPFCKRQCFLELICAILRPLQSELLLGALEEGEQTDKKIKDKEEATNYIFGQEITEKYIWPLDCKLEYDASQHELYFYKDIILVVPWNRSVSYDRYIQALCNYGNGKPQPWKQDAGNH